MNRHASAGAAARDRPVISAWRDPWFWGFVALGPLYWVGLWLTGTGLAVSMTRAAPLTWLTLGLIVPIVEEVFFRGLLQQGLRCMTRRQIGVGVSAANLITSLVFCTAHAMTRGPSVAAGVFVPSLLFGLCYERHRSLASPVALHCSYNSGYFLLFGW
ncbi:JDVT-CTERM system glutamic-type intramembrane protease [Salinisphaera sp. Q1T1-3]|uniref:JDVT-CTERM system glutamic-type intramembrane protease MrtJ n=1 Tax=Salinisphaera sp. Q1T1-3 TaxID=2321229 RepID=UPI000E74D25D|nr:JDVT-CTERM system glutamic-type intramembrane protease [Salinisphaera sp. Q1T1-3]RJS91855.1 JDVT-CTERM system CAAX-type protease [Salinisphaera sp. Q1T1-3]